MSSSDKSAAPIDIVVTWVDGSDEEWVAEKREWLKKENSGAGAEWLTGDKRYRDWGLLPYWFRGVEKCAPWVRTVHFVTSGHLPAWLNTEDPRLHVVRHSDFIPAKYLPTFNSHTIELNMHRIPGLAEQFIYFNDDTYLLKEVHMDDFFMGGLPRDFTGLDMRSLNRVEADYRPYNAMVINEHFSKDEVMKKHRSLWYSPKYGMKCLSKTMLLAPFARFCAFQTDHLPINFLKSTFNEVWQAEPGLLDSSCAQRFRGQVAVSPWLMRDWQRCKGEFVPKKPEFDAFLNCGFARGDSELGRQKVSDIDTCAKRVVEPTGMGMLCLNDYCNTDEDFRLWGDALREAFEKRFPNKSGFEL